jgi:hypothetical protein
MDILGFDTETHKGYVKVLTCSNGNYIESDNADELLDFLFTKSVNFGYNVFYNIEYDLGSIIKKYIIENGEDLHKEFYEKIKTRLLGIDNREEDSGYSFNIGKYHIVYLSQKMFSIRRNKTIKYFWDSANFYKSGYGHMTLNNASKMYLGIEKNDKELNIDRAKIGSEKGYYEKHRDKIIEYSIKDCVLTAKLFARTIDGFRKIGFSFPLKPYSEASIFKEYLTNKWENEMLWAEYYLESEYHNYIRGSYRGGIFNTLNIGHFENVYDIDLNSAYPFNLSKLYSVVDSKVLENKESDYTFYHVRTHPNAFFPIRIKDRLIYGLSKKPIDYYINEYDKKILDMYDYKYEIIDFVGIETKKKRALPEIEDFYRAKNEIKYKYGNNSVEYYNIKILLNSGYGIFAQSYPSYSKYTNFIYASYVTSMTRFYIANILKKMDHDRIINIATDGIMFEDTSSGKDIEIFDNEFKGEEIGKWKIEFYDSITQYANGIYLLKNGDKYVLKKRGFEQLRINDLYKDIPEITFQSYKPMKIISAIIQRKYDSINDFLLQSKTFSPYLSWLNTNPITANEIMDYNISDFHSMQKEVKPFYVEDYEYFYTQLGDENDQ